MNFKLVPLSFPSISSLIFYFIGAASARPVVGGHLLPFLRECPLTHTVTSGETCALIAPKYLISVEDLEFLNPEMDCLSLYVNQPLCVAGGKWEPCAVDYFAVKGDTCYDLAIANGLTLDEFLQLNPSIDCDVLPINQRVCLKKSNETVYGGVNIAKKDEPTPLATAAASLPSSTPQPTGAPQQVAKAAPVTSTQPTTSSPRPSTPTAAPVSQPVSQPAPVANVDNNFPNGDNGLAAHNRYRAREGTPPLSWSSSLAVSATAWAGNLAANGCKLVHTQNAPYGENLYAMWNGTPTMDKVLDDWMNEPRSSFAHWSQVIWKDTTQVGCGFVRGNNCVAIACHYSPHGNVIGQSPV